MNQSKNAEPGKTTPILPFEEGGYDVEMSGDLGDEKQQQDKQDLSRQQQGKQQENRSGQQGGQQAQGKASKGEQSDHNQMGDPRKSKDPGEAQALRTGQEPKPDHQQAEAQEQEDSFESQGALKNVREKERPFVIKKHTLKMLFSKAEDIVLQDMLFEDQNECIVMYNSGLTSSQLIDQVVFPDIRKIYEKTKFHGLQDIKRAAEMQWIELEETNPKLYRNKLFLAICSGNVCMALPGLQRIFTVDVNELPTSDIKEAATEVTVLGPRDGFTESITKNVALIRKRITSSALCCEYFRIGERTSTRVALMYMQDIINDDLISDVRERLGHIDVEALHNPLQLDELVQKKDLSLFPLSHYSGRPDFCTESLMAGRFVLLVDHNPTAIIAPTTLTLTMKSSEDSYTNPSGANIGRLWRTCAFLITVFLPGLYITLTVYHPEQIPFPLLAAIALGRYGMPMETTVEMVVIIFVIEIFREATMRVPSAIGASLTVVGGIILGENIIRAGIVSPASFVVAALSVMGAQALVNQMVISTVFLFRMFVFFMSAFLGIFGFFMSTFLVMMHMVSLKSYNMPYMAPLTPFNATSTWHTFNRMPFMKRTKRPNFLRTQKPIRRGRKQ